MVACLARLSPGLAVSALATLAGFVVNRNIFNSDNYRYLVTLLVPWCSSGLSWQSNDWLDGAGKRRWPRHAWFSWPW